eukprot:2608697-Amphidinium_carterae.1
MSRVSRGRVGVRRETLNVPQQCWSDVSGSPRSFDLLVASRREQIAKGLPLGALPLNVGQENLFVRAVALLAERMDIATGED